MMAGLIDENLVNYPTFVPDVDNYMHSNCKYFAVDELSPLIYGVSFSILMLNIRSCRKNFDHFLATFCNYLSYFSCIIFIETWLTCDRDNVFDISGFCCFNLYRDQYGGGLKLYLKNGVQSRVLDNFSLLNNLFEMLTVELLFGNKKTVLTTIYHPPSSCHVKNMDFVHLFTSYLKQLTELRLPLIVGGDFNLNLLNPNNFAYIDTYIKNMFELGMNPLITIPTKMNIDNPITPFSILDQIWVSNNLENKQTFVIPCDITDHFAVGTFILSPCLQLTSAYSFKRRPLLARGRDTFKALLSNIYVNVMIGDVNGTYNDYFGKVYESYNISFPLKNNAIKFKHSVPWISLEIKQCIKKKAKLYKQYLKGRISKADYTVYKNRLTNVIRKSKILYFKRAFLEAANNSKLIWSVINNIMDKKKNKELKEIKVNGETLKGKALCNYANDYFVKVAVSITCLIRHRRFVCLSAPVTQTCFFYPTDSVEVSRIMGMKNKGSKLLDIHPSVLKENCGIFADHISKLYNASLHESMYPDAMKIARVTPCYKSGAEDVIDNYRPISALPVLSKIFEKLTFIRMNSFIARYCLLSPCQFGFRKGRSTTQAIIKLMSPIIQAYHQKIYCACFFLDLRKAFDTIDHRLLLQKLSHYGFRGLSFEYLRSYYKNRKQYVYINGESSNLMPITVGVPQGSILGPLCFSLFINDLPQAVDEITVLFADDAAFVITSTTLEGLYGKISKLFSDLSTYLNDNRLVANSNKSKLMMFTSRPIPDLPDLAFNDNIIECVSEFKYLGLTISKTLSFATHINNISLNVSRITGSLVNLRSFVPLHVLIKLYYALVFPHLTNNVIIWGSAPTSHMKRLTVRVNNMLRVILGVRWENGRPTVGTDEIYKQLGLLKVENIFKYNMFKLLRQLLDGQIMDFMELLLSQYASTHTYQTRQIRYRHPALTCEVERRGLPHQLILLYESLPEDIFTMSFRKSLKSFRELLFQGQ